MVANADISSGGGERRKAAKTRIITAVWGKWHVEKFVTISLSSLLAPGNLPSFAKRVETSYIIYTRAGDAPRISTAPIFRTLQRHLDARVVTLDEEHFRGNTLDDHVANHHRIWNQAMEEAAKDQALAMLAAPDLCWADGSLAYIASLLEQGKRVIYAKPARVTDETFSPVILSNYSHPPEGSIRIGQRQLVALSIAHSHPLWAMNIPGSGHTPWHSELVIKPVPGEGYWMPLFTTDGFVVDAIARSALKHSTPPPPLRDVSICADSEQLAAVSLTPLAKDPDWWFDAHPFEALRIGIWWTIHEIPESALLYPTPFRFCAAEPTRERWAQVGQESDRLVRRARRLLHVVSIVQAVQQLGGHRSSVVAASLYRSRWLQRQLTLDEPLTLLIPADGAYAELPEWFWQQAFSHGADARYLERLVADYVVRGVVELQENGDGIEGKIEAAALSGRSLTFRRHGKDLTVEGLRVLSSGRTLAGHILHIVDRLLPDLDSRSGQSMD